MGEPKRMEEELDESLVEHLADEGEIASQEVLEERLSERITGRLDGLRHTILSLVVEGRYDSAIAEINFYSSSDQKLAVFKNRSQRYFNHCEELIRAVESKIKFCQTRTITRSQKHELYIMVIRHFSELTESLKKVERIENDIRIKDLKSTVWVLKAFVMSIGVIILVGMIRQFFFNMCLPYMVIVNDVVGFVFGFLKM